MELSLVECIVEPHHSINSSSSRSSDVTASSVESDGDAPVIVVSHSRYDITRDAPVIVICRLVRWHRPIDIYTIGKYNFYFYYQK